jgi:hypothetical protein
MAASAEVRRRFSVALLAVAFAAASCAGGSESADATPTAIATVTSTPATATATIEPSTTAGTSLGPSGPSTVAATSIDPATEQAIKDGVQHFFAAYMACGQAPTKCHPADFHSGRGTAVGQGTVYFQGLAARGEYFSQDLGGSYIVTQSVALDDPTSAVAFSCWYDASILLGPAGADGRPTVLNDKAISVRQKQALYFDGAEWQVGEAATVQDLGDGNQCPPADADPAGSSTTTGI